VAQKDQELKAVSLKLDEALSQRVKALSEYQSEFFANLKKHLGQVEGMRVVGDRFIFQSEVLFEVGSDAIGPDGLERLKHMARVLKNISVKIPPHIRWILRVDGHTDALPMRSRLFPSNWELSTARALAVVKCLMAEGIPPHHLVAAGFGEFHPLDSQNLARNRRIEFKLDQR
jgi:chemotaxis protein MotB